MWLYEQQIYAKGNFLNQLNKGNRSKVSSVPSLSVMVSTPADHKAPKQVRVEFHLIETIQGLTLKGPESDGIFCVGQGREGKESHE